MPDTSTSDKTSSTAQQKARSKKNPRARTGKRLGGSSKSPKNGATTSVKTPVKSSKPAQIGKRSSRRKDPAALLELAESKLKQAEMLLSVSRKIAAIESLEEVLRTLINITTKELNAERGTLFLNDPNTGE